MTTLPLLPLRGITVFPNMVLHLDVGRDQSVEALETAMLSEEKLVFLVAQKESNTEDPGLEDLYTVGTISTIKQMLKLPNGTIRVLAEGITKAKIVEIISNEKFNEVIVEELIDIENDTSNNEALSRSLTICFEQYCKISHRLNSEVFSSVVDIDDISRLTYIIASHLPLKLNQKQVILEGLDLEERIENLLKYLNSEIEVTSLEQKIVSRVKNQMEKAQKEYYLREQIKAIQFELGEKETNLKDGQMFRDLLKKLKVSTETKEKIIKEIERLERIPTASAESSVIRSYVECLVELPWDEQTEDNFDINSAEKILNEDHYGLEKAKERILEHLAVQQMVQKIQGPILCLVGPPGVGKTSIAKSIARALNRKFHRISLGGVNDESEIRGHRRTYIGSMPGRLAQGLRLVKTANPIFLLDEIDKMGSDYKGDPQSALLEVLDHSQNSEFIDHYVEIPINLSNVMFIATANSLHNISRPLLDRMEIIHISGYTEMEKVSIAKEYLFPKQLKSHGLDKSKMQIYSSTFTEIIRSYTREAGVRNLERQIGTLCRKVVRKILTTEVPKKITITTKNLDLFLGRKKFAYDKADTLDQIGMATGLAWTEVGGDTLPVEVSIYKGKGILTLTGKLGETMKESAKAAFSYIRSRSHKLGIAENFIEKHDIHIHVPEGSIPKDGPSAGITMATAIVSAVTKIPVSCKVAMTGEITLRGRVLAIGGLKEKALGAFRAGITQIIIPKENEKDLEDIPESIRESLNFEAVEHMDDVLKLALVRDPYACYQS